MLVHICPVIIFSRYELVLQIAELAVLKVVSIGWFNKRIGIKS